MFWMFALCVVAIGLAFGFGYSQSELDRIKNPDAPLPVILPRSKDPLVSARLND